MEATLTTQQLAIPATYSKANQSSIADGLIAQVVNGSVDPMQAYIQVKAIAEVCEQFLKSDEIVSRTQGAVARNEGNLPSFDGAKVLLANTTRYDYATSQDPEYLDLSRQKDAIVAKMKAREMFLKTIDDTLDYVDRETGEVRTIFAPARKTTKTLRVTFAKS